MGEALDALDVAFRVDFILSGGGFCNIHNAVNFFAPCLHCCAFPRRQK